MKHYILATAKARSEFMRVTSSRYSGMRARLKRKQLPPPPFSLAELRTDVLSVMENRVDGAIVCRYCKGVFPISDVALDHATPLSRGGDAGLSNIDYPCMPCNDRKGGLTLEEFESLLSCLGNIPLGRTDVLKRLQQSTKLAAAARFALNRKGEQRA
jgi:HNH endonuclease